MKLFDLNFEPFRDFSGWYVCTEPTYSEADQHALGEIAKTLLPQARIDRYQLVSGLLDDDQPGHQLFAVFDIHPCDLITEFRVGSHNNEEQVVDEVYAQMTRIYETVRPFRPYFVDAAGYHCAFEGRITKPESEKIEKILTVGLEWYWSRWERSGSPVVPVVLRENELHIWWD